MAEVLKQWRILDLLKASEVALRERQIANPRLNAELLLADTLGTSRINLYLDFEKPLTESELSSYRDKIKRRIKHEPLQYIRGFAEFFGLQFKVRTSVLIPRQETEILVETSLDAIKNLKNPKILEIGTGSGCISVSIASKIQCHIDAIDINENSLQLAEENSMANHTEKRITFIKKNILGDFSDFNGYDIIISNPPYIPQKEIDSLMPEVRDYEPIEALTDNSDGLTFYRRIFGLAKQTVNPLKIFLEIGDGKKENVEELINQYGFKNYTFIRDLMNIHRVLQIDFNQPAE